MKKSDERYGDGNLVDDYSSEDSPSEVSFGRERSRDSHTVEYRMYKNSDPRKKRSLMKMTIVLDTSVYHEGILEEVDEDESWNKDKRSHLKSLEYFGKDMDNTDADHGRSSDDDEIS